MRTIHFSDARSNLKAVMDQAIDDHDAVLITRRDAPNVVIMSQEQYDSWMETMHLLSSPANAARLLRSIQQHRAGMAEKHELIDPDAE
ncbi:type II toxin-antitoxin system Phd/YefM family antitoxin [Cupriavidus alkaliphilus]|uniref:type II toxin-antitoxin system Phd/YefM family antitoxin n=1 Tax=Cupriavidus alkaliphilus TaxID=942866 RepID=UPI001610AEC2|nr:type II toxin-antitoxin system prevent-host-death family antitoxin [Cupriavidus alkaliphilus]MBB2918407.1 antitoxin YefM [Cupriavidus alkaliphilus]MBB3014024.1 antitoxin YefM [Cupriavidus alkaliphilus]